MRFFQSLAFSAFFLLAGVSSAWAYQFNMTTSYGGEALSVGETVTVDVFVDVDEADPGPTILSIAIVNSDPAVLAYDEVASAALTPYAGCGSYLCGTTSGAQPSYILYTAAMGMGNPSTVLYPLQTPAWLNFPPIIPGTEQVNINLVEAAFGIACRSGTGIYIASMVFNVIAESGSAGISLEFLSSSLVQSGTLVVDPAGILLDGTPLSGPPISVTVPEPAAGGLALAGLATVTLLYRAHRRRAQR